MCGFNVLLDGLNVDDDASKLEKFIVVVILNAKVLILLINGYNCGGNMLALKCVGYFEGPS